VVWHAEVKCTAAAKALIVLQHVTQFTAGRRGEHPRGMPLITCTAAPSIGAKACNSMGSSSETFCQQTRTIQQPQPDDVNPNTAESMMQTAHRTLSFMSPANIPNGKIGCPPLNINRCCSSTNTAGCGSVSGTR
jgi:hypothetical protein